MDETLRLTDRARLRSLTGSPQWRVLVVANQTATSPELIAQLQERSKRVPVRFHLVVPMLNSHLCHWVSDIDGAVSAAHRRAEAARAALLAHGLAVSVEIGDSVPLHAIDDALAQFEADEIVISTLPPERSHWLEHNLVDLARDRFSVPVRHVVASEEGLLPADLPAADSRSYPMALDSHAERLPPAA